MADDEKKFDGLPVAGYTPQSPARLAIVNANKVLEERCLRQVDAMAEDQVNGLDKTMVECARLGFINTFIWLNRSVFQPSRIELPEDGTRPGPD